MSQKAILLSIKNSQNLTHKGFGLEVISKLFLNQKRWLDMFLKRTLNVDYDDAKISSLARCWAENEAENFISFFTAEKKKFFTSKNAFWGVIWSLGSTPKQSVFSYISPEQAEGTCSWRIWTFIDRNFLPNRLVLVRNYSILIYHISWLLGL